MKNMSSTLVISLSLTVGACASPTPHESTAYIQSLYSQNIGEICWKKGIEPLISENLSAIYLKGIEAIVSQLDQTSPHDQKLIFTLFRGSKIFYIEKNDDVNASICISPSGDILIFFTPTLYTKMQENQNIGAFVMFHEMAHRIKGSNQHDADALAISMMGKTGYNSQDPALLLFIKTYVHR